MNRCPIRPLLAVAVLIASLCSPGFAHERPLVVASTTSLPAAGFFDYLLPKFTAATGIRAEAVSLPTPRALASAARGDADVIFINDPAAGRKFVGEGNGAKIFPIMWNEFIILGPPSDPAKIARSTDAPAALRQIARLRAPYVSRGDQSGTHVAEMALWQKADVNPKARSGTWYRETGVGMGETIVIASRLDAYVFADSATWLALKDKISIVPIVHGEPLLKNQYLIVTLDRARHPQARHDAVDRFVTWLRSKEGQDSIAAFRIDGEPAFFPNANKELKLRPTHN